MAKVPVLPESVYQCLQSLNTGLRDEVQAPTPHLCARHVSTFNIHTTLTQVSSTYNDEAIIRETLDIFKILLDSEEGEFVGNKTFADALMGYVSSISAVGLDARTEGQMVEVLFAICTKLRLEPDFLSTWFRPATSPATESSDPRGNSNREDFLLFYLIVDYIHHDGRVGDFARTGLLYLLELAGQSSVLEQWIIEGDLALLMASGLGALYSQLSRKLVVAFERESTPTILTLSETQRSPTPNDAETTTSGDFKAHLATFLSHLVFWQDILEHCTSTEVKRSLLDHFKFLFLQQLLYPSLIESSDVDGGSSVAVLTYLRCIIESINHPELIDIVFQYLLAVPEPEHEEPKPSRPVALARRRKSNSLVANLAKGQDQPVPDLFNLVDLIMTGMRSRNHQTVTATVRLVCVLLRNRHQYNFSLFKMRAQDGPSVRSMEEHEHDVLFLLHVTENLARFDGLHDSYKAHLHDVQSSLEHHACSSLLLTLPDSVSDFTVKFHSIEPTDLLLETFVGLLKGFFANDIETNLGLTQAISVLALCGSLQLSPWLLPSSGANARQVKSVVDKVQESTSDNVAGLGIDINRQEKPTPGQGPPKLGVPQSSETGADLALSPIFEALDSLVQQVDSFRREVKNFDIFLSERKHVFQVGDEMDDMGGGATDSPKSRRSEDSNANAAYAKPKPTAPIGSISQRLMSTQSSAQGSRASSPRGRQIDKMPSTPAPGAGRLSHLHIPPSPSSPNPDTRAFSPSPLRKTSLSATPPLRVDTPMGPPDAFKQKMTVRLPFSHSSSASGKISTPKRQSRDLSGKLEQGPPASETSSLRSESLMGRGEVREGDGKDETVEVGLSQVLTNVVILQEFVLELAAIAKVRARLFGEVQ